MKRQNDIDSRIHRMCRFYGTDEEEMLERGTQLLTGFRDVCRANGDAALDTMDDLLSHAAACYGEESASDRMYEALIQLEFFADEASRSRYEDDIDGILRTGWMIRVMEALKRKVYGFADYGPEFVEILNLCYMNAYDYDEQDILEALSMGRSTYFRKKKRAVILFGLAFREYMISLGNRQIEQRGPEVGEQIRLAI